MKTAVLSTLILFISLSGSAQIKKYYSVHQEQQKFYDSLAIFQTGEYKELTQSKIKLPKNTNDCNLQKIVFGWHPYWMNGSEQNYQWNLLSDLSYFSYEVDPVTGAPLTTHGWETASAVDDALANGVKVNLCVTLFSGHESFFASAEAQQNLIDNLLTLVQNRNANGINIDFESVPSSETTNFTNFLINLSDQFHTNIPGSQVSIALYAVDWSSVFDIPVLKDYIDLFIIMGYGYYWGSSSTAGPTGQLYKMYNFNYTISRSISSYLNKGIPREKLICAVPYYGIEWQTQSESIPSSTTASGHSKTIKAVKNNTSGYYNDKQLEENSLSNYYVYNLSGNWHQTWVDDETTMKYKYDVIQHQDIAGIGIWALGYDDGYTEMWDLIRDRFSDCSTTPCQYTIFDMGGPARNYYNNEDYTFTISPDNVSLLSLSFSSFSLEAGFDSLWMYDGYDTNAPLVGAFSGTTNPGIIEVYGDAFTLRFHSDGGTTKSGWIAEWNCSPISIESTTMKNIDIYPNPASGILNFSDTPDKIKLYNIKGRFIKQYNETKSIDVSGLPNGFYILKINSSNNIIFKKLIVQH